VPDWKFDPCDLPDISHLHEGDQNRIRAGGYDARELGLLQQGQNPWTKSGKPEPLKKGKPDNPQGELPLSTGIRVPEQQRSLTAQEERDRKLRAFMSDQVRAAYDAADFEQSQIIWAANERAFEEAEVRKEQKRLRDQERMEKIFDMLQRLKEDPTKAHLLPPANASIQDLDEWYDEMSRPVRNIPFAEPSEEYLRQQRIADAYLRGQRPDPKDLADKARDDLRYKQELSEHLEEVKREFSSSQEPARKEEKAKPGARSDSKPAHPTGAANRERELRTTVKLPITEYIADDHQLPSSPSKVTAFFDSNLTWGSLGVLSSGLATLISSAALLFFGWAMLTVSLYRHFFKGKPWYWQIIGTVFVGSAIGMALLVIWMKSRPQ
jgi:hypothetical protein